MKLKRSTRRTVESRGLERGRLFVALVALASGGACGTGKTDESSITNNGGNLAERCEVKPPFVGNFQPVLDWAWTGSPVIPTHKQVMMQPVVVDVNQDGTPDIVFSTFDGDFYNAKVRAEQQPNVNGVLRAISGKGGQELWTVTDETLRVKPAASLAAGDLDGDGAVEICGIPESGHGIICFEHDGTFKFRTETGYWDYNEWGGPSLADLDGDGSVEIIGGNRVYTNTGALKWMGVGSSDGAKFTGPVPVVADIDQDGKLEVINGRSVYRHDGTLKCANTELVGGYDAVANFDSDAAGEIVVSGWEKVSLLDDDCTLLWSRDVHLSNPAPGRTTRGHGGAPLIADLDGDGSLEIGVAGDWDYTVYGADGAVKWSHPIRDFSSGKTTSTAFDFDGDGRVEVVFADELRLRIFDGPTGAVRFETAHTSATSYEGPVVVDVDGDNAADIVVAQNNHASWQGFHGIRVFRDAKEGWAHTRRIWNQHAYSVTNVNDDGTIPSYPATNWLNPKLNTFRGNVAQYVGSGPSPYAAPDLVASDVTISCDGYGSLVLGARVVNQGEAPVAAGTKVAFYKGNPASGGTLLGVTSVGLPLARGESFIVTLSVSTATTGTAEVFAVVDDDGTGAGTTTECREDNNTASATGNLSCAVTPANKPPVALCRDVIINADQYCLGRASVDNGSYDPDNGPSPLTLTEEPNVSFGLGTHTVTLTAFDGEESSQCVGRVTVVDNTKPTIECPASQELETCSPAGAPATFQASAADICGAAPLSCSHASGSTFPVGDTAVSCSATDGSGNRATCGFNVKVKGDTTAPVLSCPTTPVVVTVDTCSDMGSPATFNASATDNCGPVPVTCSHESGTAFPGGDTLVTCSATDAFGNSSSCEFVVTVNGTFDPTLPPTPGADKGLELWPPNHKYVDVSLADCAEPAKDACGNPLPLENYGQILRVTSDEVEDANGNGDGRTCDDMEVVVGHSSVRLRAEREGRGDGRIYTIHYAVKTDEGASAQSSCRVHVPHDQSGRGAVDSGVKFCVGNGCPAGTTEGSQLCK
jgi:hypothetical protein